MIFALTTMDSVSAFYGDTDCWTLSTTVVFFAIVRTSWTWVQTLFRYFVIGVLSSVYRIKIEGLENLPKEGGVVFLGNHSSLIDGALLLMIMPRRTRTIAWSGNFSNRLMIWLARFCEIVLISGGPKSLLKGLQEAKQALLDGQAVLIFPEGTITRTGSVQSFRPGIRKIIEGMDVPVIPIYIDQIWGSIFTYCGGKAIWKFPKSFRHRITITIGRPVENPDSVYAIRQSLQQLGTQAVENRQPPFVLPVQSFIRACKRQRFKFKSADSTGNKGTGGVILMRSLILRRLLHRHVLGGDENHVGVLIPPSVGGAITNMALALDRRVAVNLNYTVSNAIMNQCISQAGIRHILTTRKVMANFDFKFDCEVTYLDDLKEKVSWTDKVAGAIGAYVTPAFLLESGLGLNWLNQDDVLTIIFTSGSTGSPKGVMLTHQNIGTNIDAIDQVINLRKTDVVIGILPFFHSFGYTVTLWAPLALRIVGVYHFSPLDASQIGKLCQQYNVTILLSTPTFLRTYLRKCTPEQFHALDVVVAGAEKLPVELCEAFEKKFGVRPVEGYGTTELSPLVSVNIPASRRGNKFMIDCKEGTVGRTIPNVSAKILGIETGEVLDQDQDGQLWISGPNVMKGYLGQPEKTADVVVDGWYNTGDVARIDVDGFIKITGRISRFSKIGGEMVPHVTVEDALSSQLSEEEQDQPRFAVTAVTDARKGERLIVLHTKLNKSPAEYIAGLTAAGLPNLFIPTANNFIEVESLPVLGTGKLDLRGVRELAEKLVGKSENQK